MSRLGTYGRTGNILFQAAAGIALAKSLERDLYIPDFEGSNFINIGDYVCFMKMSRLFRNKYFGEMYARIFRNRIKYDGNNSSDFFTLIQNIDNLDVCGYFQSEDFFKAHKSIVMRAFQPKPEFQRVIDYAVQELDAKNCTAIHVRRGDYLSLSDYHPTQKVDYYQKAIKTVDDFLGGVSKKILFTDDLSWCLDQDIFKDSAIASHLTLLDDLLEALLHLEPGIDELHARCWLEIYLMSECQSVITSNSSFSWWGAYMSNSVVRVSPKQWFGGLLHDENDSHIVPKGWIRV